MKQRSSPFRGHHLCVIIVSVVLLCGGTHSHTVWKDETDWAEHLGPPRRGPHFLPDIPTNISVTVGRSITLPCQVANLRGRSVSWIRQSDLQVLTTNKNVFTSDERFNVIARRISGVWSWNLVINDPAEEDGGGYECQINTRPKLSHPVQLQVIQAGAVIAGPPEVYVNTGSRLLLTCWVHAPPKPPGPLSWIHNGTVLDSLTPRGGLSLHVAVEGARASTRLSLLHVTPKDAGNYTCQPEGLDSANVTVFVLQDEAPAAMHHDSCCPASHQNSALIFALLSVCAVFENLLFSAYTGSVSRLYNILLIFFFVSRTLQMSFGHTTLNGASYDRFLMLYNQVTDL